MRDKINQLADGVFEYKQPEVVVRPENLKLKIDAGSSYQGSFEVSDIRKHMMKGEVTTDSPYLTILEPDFQGLENEITYIFNAENIDYDTTIEGKFQIISDCGIRKVPFQACIMAKPQEDSGEEALDHPVYLKVKRRVIQFDHCVAPVDEKIVITRDQKGDCEITIHSDAAFAVPEKSRLTAEDFEGKKCTVLLKIDPEKMAIGKNYARVRIQTVYQTLELTVTAVRPGTSHDQMLKNKRRQRSLHQMIKRHIDFSMDRLPLEDYVVEMKRLLKNGGFKGDNLHTRLYRLHLAILEGNSSQVNRELDSMESQIEVLHREEPVIYAAYYYLKGIWSDEDSVVADCTDRIRESYDKQGKHWQAMWFLLYLDPEMQGSQHKLEIILKQLEAGCSSPVMYLEACQILNESPKYVTKLNPQMGEILHWGCKKQYLNRELALCYVYLVSKRKQYSVRILQDLILLYEQFPEDEILTEICKMLMKGQSTSQEAFTWYAKGIERNLKITELYEYYMYSLDEEQDVSLNASILLYFLYDNHLTVEKKAMLYAYIICRKEENSETYESYQEAIWEFCMHQLEQGRISRNLAVLYTEFIDADHLDDKIAAALSDVMFRHQISCSNKNIMGVLVKHPELSEEEFVPLHKGCATVNVVSSRAKIYMVDGKKRRYAHSIDYQDDKLLELDDLAENCLEYQKSDIRFLIYRYDQLGKQDALDSDAEGLFQEIAKHKDISDSFRQEVFSRLLHHCQENDSHALDEMIGGMDWKMLYPEDRLDFIRYCASHKYYEKAIEGIWRYGFEQLDARILLTVFEETFQDESLKEDCNLIKLAWHMFWEGIYNDDTLRYLCRYYTGTVEEMVQIWAEAQRANLDTLPFQERLLAQAVFSGEMVSEVFEIFYFYQEQGTNKRLLLAFKKWMAYEYLLKNRTLPVEMFGYYFRDVQIQENIPCLIAVLKYFSTCANLSEEEVNFADYHLMKLYDNKIIFPFYQDFYGKFPLPTHIMDERYIEYIADPAYEVTIHYRVLASDGMTGKFRVEKMRDVFEGIRVKEFVLFQDEILEYYVTEHRPGEEVKSPVEQITMVESMDKARASSRYHTLNLMMIAQEMHDDITLIDLMEEYAKDREMAKEVFRTI